MEVTYFPFAQIIVLPTYVSKSVSYLCTKKGFFFI